jgi:hypothetical protein
MTAADVLAFARPLLLLDIALARPNPRRYAAGWVPVDGRLTRGHRRPSISAGPATATGATFTRLPAPRSEVGLIDDPDESSEPIGRNGKPTTPACPPLRRTRINSWIRVLYCSSPEPGSALP